MPTLSPTAIAARAEALAARLSPCTLCPRACGVDRLAGARGACGVGAEPELASFAAHYGEEPFLSGTHLARPRGSGTVFLAGCNLRCHHCQNWQISWGWRGGRGRRGVDLAAASLELQRRGCHNLNLVSPTHQTPGIVAALASATAAGLSLPVVWNSNAYEEVDVLALLEGVVDVWLPDLKYADEEAGHALSGVARYPEVARAAILEMARQVGTEPVYDGEGLLVRGLAVRVLVLPEDLAGVESSLRWLRWALGTDIPLSLMSQYGPTPGVRDPRMRRPLRPEEYQRAMDIADQLGFDTALIQPLEDRADLHYRPDFDDPERPFADAEEYARGCQALGNKIFKNLVS
ncbi:MAG: radical SAM protein [Pseudomonadota bacterium]